MMTWFWLAVGLGVLSAGAEFLVRGAVGLAAAMRISPLTIGLTVVAFGTSAPELVVSMRSAFAGQGDIALGNVVGSNIFNVLFILGLAALVVPLRVASRLIRFDVPLLIILSLAVYGICQDGRIDRVEGSLLVTSLVVYTMWSIWKGRRDHDLPKLGEFTSEYSENVVATPGRIVLDAWMVIGGLGMLVVGGGIFIDNAVAVARTFGVSELVIGLTLVAAGTSLPEVATSLLAAIKGERDIAVGNVIGSNIFNIMGVAGFTAMLGPNGIPVSATAISLDIPVMVLVSVACLPVFFIGHTIMRWEGGFFLAFYVIYTRTLVAQAQAHTEMVRLFTAIAWVLSASVVLVYTASLVTMWRHRTGHN